jgi:hypothetical protein
LEKALLKMTAFDKVWKTLDFVLSSESDLPGVAIGTIPMRS